MQRVIIVGAGGHAKVVADILLRAREAGAPVVPVGYLDDNAEIHGQLRIGLPILGRIDELDRFAHDALVIGIGANRIRQQLFARFQAQGEHFAIARHPAATIAPDVVVGVGTMIAAGAVVNPSSVIGANVILNTASSVDHDNRIADHAHIAPGAHLGGNVTVGEGTMIGMGATVLQQRRIGSWSVVGAAALVYADLPSGVVAYGAPARIVRSAD